jgi:hypothetical protein
MEKARQRNAAFQQKARAKVQLLESKAVTTPAKSA